MNTERGKVQFVHPYSYSYSDTVVNGSNSVTLSDTWANNDCGTYQCQQIGSPVKCMIAIRPLVMYSGQSLLCCVP